MLFSEKPGTNSMFENINNTMNNRKANVLEVCPMTFFNF